MRKILYFVAACLAFAALVSCEENQGMAPYILDSNDFTLEVKGRVVQNFNKSECQLTLNADRKEFRVGDDKMAEYYILQCNKVPAAKGETLNVNLSWTMSGSVQSREGLRFSVEKIGDDGRIWLWDAKDGIAAIICKPVY